MRVESVSSKNMPKNSAIQSDAPGTVTVIDNNQLSQPSSFSKPLVLRLTNQEDQSTQEFEIDKAKCLLGSGNHADVQIPQQGIKEIHCEFIRNPVGIYVRQFDGDILVNGLLLEEAWVFPGDKIQVGNLKVEIIEIGHLVLETSESGGVEQGQVTQSRAKAVVKQVATVGAANAGEQNSVAEQKSDWENSDDQIESGNQPISVPEESAKLLAKIDLAVKEAEVETPPAVKSSRRPKPDAEKKFESVADVVKRMQDAGKLEAVAGVSGDLASPVAESAKGTSPNEEGVEGGDADEKPGENDESVTDYMTQLMQRLKTGDEETKKDHVDVIDRNAGLKTLHKEEEVEEDLTPENPMLPDEFVPTNVAPEKTSTLKALRQVANQAVESAIDRSAKERSSETSLGYLGASTLCLFISTVLFMFSAKPFDIAFIVGMASAVGCVGWAFMYLSFNIARDRKSQNRSRRKVARSQRKK